MFNKVPVLVYNSESEYEVDYNNDECLWDSKASVELLRENNLARKIFEEIKSIVS